MGGEPCPTGRGNLFGQKKIHGSLCAKENKMRGRVSVLKYTKNKREGNTSLSYLMKIQIP
jgi:hypothetical protein